MKMLKSFAFCSALALALTATVVYESNALEYWPTLDADIAQSIIDKVVMDDRSDAPRVRVEVSKIAVDGDTMFSDDSNFNQLEGTVVVMDSLNDGVIANSDEGNSEILQSFSVGVSATSPDIEVPEGWVVLSASDDEFYEAMVEGFANAALERIDF